MARVVAHGVRQGVVGDLFAEARSDNIRVAEVDPAVDAGVDDLIDTLAEGSPASGRSPDSSSSGPRSERQDCHQKTR